MSDAISSKDVSAELGAKGEVVAIVGTLGQVDNDGEVIMPDAVPSDMQVIMSDFDHSSVKSLIKGADQPTQPPVGKGKITVEGNKVVYRGNYFMETQRGREAYLTTKALGSIARWSFAYGIKQIAKPTLDLMAKGARRILTKLGPLPGADFMEVSPVPLPGGKGTGTVSLKALDGVQYAGLRRPAELELIGTPTPSQELLIERVVKACGHLLPRPLPTIGWYTRQSGQKAVGMALVDRDEIHLSTELCGRDLVISYGHECHHIAQGRRLVLSGGSEEAAEVAGRYLARAFAERCPEFATDWAA